MSCMYGNVWRPGPWISFTDSLWAGCSFQDSLYWTILFNLESFAGLFGAAPPVALATLALTVESARHYKRCGIQTGIFIRRSRAGLDLPTGLQFSALRSSERRHRAF